MENIKFSVDLPSLSAALINTVNPQKLTMKLSNLFLDEENRKNDFILAVFFIIEKNNNCPNNLDLIGMIYLKKFLEKSYKYHIFPPFKNLYLPYLQTFERRN